MTTKINPAGSAFTFVAADDRGNTVTANQGGGLLLTGSTGGFLYVPGMTGAPASSAGPTGYTGTVAHVFDVSNNMPWYLNPVNTFGGSTGATPGWVAGNGQVLIQKVVLGGATGTVTFNNIPQVFNNLRVVCLARADNSTTASTVVVQFNGDTAANYDYQHLSAVNGTASLASVIGGTGIWVGLCTNATLTANYAGTGVADVLCYTNTTFYKSLVSYGGLNSQVAANNFYRGVQGTWRNTTAITRATFTNDIGGNFIAGSTFFIYGVW